MEEPKIGYKQLEPIQIASITAQIASREEIPPLFERLRTTCNFASDPGAPLVIFHGGAVKDGFLVEVAFAVEHPIEVGIVHTRITEPVKAVIMLHHGSYLTVRDTVLKIYEYIEQHACTSSLFRREIYHRFDPASDGQCEIEVQVVLHEWDQLLAEGTERVLGTKPRDQIMQGIEAFTVENTFSDYVEWIRVAMDRLDSITDDRPLKCRVVSNCAHVFPQERIDHLKTIYQQNGVDGVLHFMNTDHFWYEKPVRRGSVIYMRKNPYDPEGYANGITPAERRKAYCHCSFVHPFLEEVPSRLSPTFCSCGAGWYTRLWQGILGQPVTITQTKTLLMGDDECTFTIQLPFELEGECLPEGTP